MNPYQSYSMNSNYQPYSPIYPQQQMYSPQQMQNPQMDRLAQLQTMQQNLQQAQMQPVYQGLLGRIVDDFGSITANDVPMNGIGAIFIKKDGSEIQVRNWTANGTIATTSYIPVLDPKNEESVISSDNPIGLKYEEIASLIATVSEKVDNMSLRLDDFMKTKTGAKTKKEVDE